MVSLSLCFSFENYNFDRSVGSQLAIAIVCFPPDRMTCKSVPRPPNAQVQKRREKGGKGRQKREGSGGRTNLNLNQSILRQPRNLHRRPSRLGLTEELGVDGVEGYEVVHVLDEDAVSFTRFLGQSGEEEGEREERRGTDVVLRTWEGEEPEALRTSPRFLNCRSRIEKDVRSELLRTE